MRFIFFLIVLALGSSHSSSQTLEERKDAITKMDQSKPSTEAQERKARSIALLKSEGVPVIDHLPVIEDSQSAKKRSAEEIAKRAIALCLVAVKGEGLDQTKIDTLVKKFGAQDFLSPKELTFIENPNPSQQDRIDFTWRYEDYWVLLWALGYVDKLDEPESICDVSKAVTFLKNRTTEQFIKDAKLRDLGDILDQADLIYRYDWAVTNARIKGQPAPAHLEKGVVQERHDALNWIIGYMDQGWDDISTDT